MPERNHKMVPVVLGVVNGGIGINWEYLDLEFEDFKTFLHALLYEMGFTQPRLVSFDRNLDVPEGDTPKVDWFRLRIPLSECEVQAVSPANGVHKARRWLASAAPHKWRRRFQVTPDPIPA